MSPEAVALAARSRSASAARAVSSMRASARPAAVAWPASRWRALAVSATSGCIIATRSARGPVLIEPASSAKPAAAWSDRCTQTLSVERASTGRVPWYPIWEGRRRSRAAVTALVAHTTAPTAPAAATGSPTAQAVPAAVAPSSSPQGSVSSCFRVTSEVGYDRGEDLVDAGGVGGVVGGGVGRVGYPPQRVEVGILAVPDREQPHRLCSLLGADLAEKDVHRDAVVLIAPVGEQYHRVDVVR